MPQPGGAPQNLRLQASIAQSKSSGPKGKRIAGEQTHATSGTFGQHLVNNQNNGRGGQQAQYNSRASSGRQAKRDGQKSNAINIIVSSPNLKPSSSSKRSQAIESQHRDSLRQAGATGPGAGQVTTATVGVEY